MIDMLELVRVNQQDGDRHDDRRLVSQAGGIECAKSVGRLPDDEPRRQVYIQRGRVFKPTDPVALNLKATLPPGTYTIGLTDEGFHIEQVDGFVLPEQLYGDVDANARRIITTFMDRPSGTGVLLSGNKGSGKTMLAKRVAQLAMQEHGIITLLISRPLCGEEFNTFLQGIHQPAVVIFDEFEKVYDHEAQPRLLTIFDGTYPSKKLFMLTCNDRFRVDTHMHNRPGRIYYAIEFGGLSPAFIKEYCYAILRNEQHISGVVTIGSFFAEFSFDMLKALVEEMNRYGESATQAMRILNIKPQSDSGVRHTIRVVRNGDDLLCDHMYPAHISRSPLSLYEDFRIQLSVCDNEGESNGSRNGGRRRQNRDPRKTRPGYISEDEELSVTSADLVGFDSSKGVFTFKTARPDTVVVFTREVSLLPATIDYDAF